MFLGQPMARLRVGLFFIFSFVICVSLALGQTASISGAVKDQNGAAVAGATVVASFTGSGQQYTAETDQNGKYEFKNLPAGEYRVKVRKSGFSDAGETIFLDGGGSAAQDFSLNLGSLKEEVTVTATKGLAATSEIPQTVTVVGESELETRRPVGIGEAFEKSPSVLSTDPNPFRARPQIRGFQGSRLLVMVDGERLQNPRFSADTVGVSPSLVDTTDVRSVEVVAGPGSSVHGSDSVGGTINILTKGPERYKDGIRLNFKVNGDYGSNADYRKGAITFGVDSKYAGIRVNFGRFIQGDYTTGKTGFSIADAVTDGKFADKAGNLVGQPLASTYPIYALAPHTKIGNSGARGYIGSIDFMVFPSDKQEFRVRFNTNPYRDLGVPFSEVPYTTAPNNTGFSNYNKLSLRYEYRDITSWFPRIAASYYNQDYRRSLEDTRWAIRSGSSFASAGPPTFANNFTGNASTFLKSGETLTIQHSTAYGYDVQANFIPVKNAIYITGLNYSNDFNRDSFNNKTFSTSAATLGNLISQLVDVANTPRSTFSNLGWYNSMEYTPVKYLRLSGGFRWDRWNTKAEPTRGFPNGTVGDVVLRTLPLIQANPGALDPVGAAGVAQLALGQTLTTKSNVGTYNIGATGFIPGGINPYVRYATTFHEPGIIERYLFRSFTTQPFFSLPSIINTNLKPEKGKEIDVGVKISRSRFQGAFSYYNNQIDNAFGTVTGVYCTNISTPTPIPGFGITVVNTPPGFGCPNPPAAPTHLTQVFQTVNFAKVVIRGFEANGEVDIPLGDVGSLTPYFSFSTTKGTNKNPDVNRLAIVNALYNSSAPIELEGSATDMPFYSLPNYQGAFAPRFTSAKGRWWAEYEYRFTSKVTRVDPNDISFAGLTTQQYFEAYKGLKKHSLRGGVRLWGGEGSRNSMVLTLGVENLTDNTYFQLFQPAPGSGRSFTIGTTINFSKIVK